MKRLVFTCVMLFITIASFSQMSSFPGYSTGNYAGVNATFSNPARIADSRYRWDFNLSSVNVGIGSSTGSYKLGGISDLFGDSLGAKLFPGNAKANANMNLDIIGPSILFNINKKNSIALTSRMRAVGTVQNADEVFGRVVLRSSNTVPNPYNSTGDLSYMNLNSWKEYGLSYGRVLSDKGKNFFSFGLTVKYLSGTGNIYLQGNNYNLTLRQDALNGNYIDAGSNGTVTVGVGGINLDNASLNDLLKSNGTGIGGDIGFEYQWRPQIEKYKMDTRRINNQYKLKFGVALLDIGKIKYTKDATKSGSYAFQVAAGDKFRLDQFGGLHPTDYKQQIFEANIPEYFTRLDNGTGTYKVGLPMNLQLYTDLNVKGGLFLNLTGQIALTKKTSAFDPMAYSGVTLTPRFENKTFALFVPLNYNNLTNFNAGLSLKAGPIFFGSGTLLSALASNSKQIDAHFGVRFGVFHKREKNIVKREPPKVNVVTDTDGDGIPDTEDKCPTVPGLAKYQGCPIPDTDGDGINDEEDKCPTVPGVAKYQGCPIPDTDGDGINDEEDKCPTVPGVARYQGCPIPDTDGDGINDEEDKCPTVKGLARYQGCPIPDTDGDGVNDEEDKCPTVAGPASNFGCPVIEKKIIEKVNLAAKNIFFATGSAKLLSKSFGPLNTVVKILKDNPTFNADIEGHTDIRGKAEMNRILSQNRANSVMAYLKSKGIDEKRLTAKGYGPDKPIASNKTAAGMAKNRRVEIHLRNY
jgi:outer membrane protein OmpA-like peptidoglycan-associated protein